MTHLEPSQSNSPHLRLTPEQTFELWKSGHYSPKGYLYHLVLAHKKAGWWWRIKSISAFCRKWKINRRSFYRAKAALISEGLFEEEIKGSVEIRVVSTNERVTSDTGVTDESSPVSDESLPATNKSQVSPEPPAPQEFCEPPDPLQIFKQLHTDEEVCVPVENHVLESEDQKAVLPSQPKAEIKKRNSQADSKKIFTPPILQRAKKLGVNVRDRILLEVVAKWPERVTMALDCLDEKQLTVKHPTRFLQKAIEEDWRPERTSSAPTGFGDWFNEARRRGLAIASEMRNEVLHVFTSDNHWLPFEQLRRMTWDELSARMHPIHTDAVTVQAPPILGV